MTVKELIEMLSALFPVDATVSLKDPNYGGPYKELDALDIAYKDGHVLIDFPIVEDCEAE